MELKKFYNNQTDNYWQHNYHLMASQRIGDFWNMNLTLHYTDGNGYYEDYKSKAKFSSYKLPEYIDPEGNTVKKTDLVRRKWLDNYFYGAIYSANYQRDNTRLTLGTAVNNYVGDHFGRVMWTKSANVLPQPDYEYYRNTGKKLDYNAYAKLTQRLSPLFTGYLDLQYRGIHYTIKGNDDKAGEGLDIRKNWNFFNPKAGINFHNNGHNASSLSPSLTGNRTVTISRRQAPRNVLPTRPYMITRPVIVLVTTVSGLEPISISWITTTN